MQDAPKELLVLDLFKGTHPKQNGPHPAQLFTTIPHCFVWKETVFSFVGVIIGNDVHFISVNPLYDSYVMFDGQKGGCHEQHSLTNAKTLAEKLQSEGYTVRWALFERVPIAEDPLNHMDENTIERVRDFIRATKIQHKPTFTISLAIPGTTPNCTHCTRKTRKGQNWKKGEACLLVDDDWPVATKDYVHLNSDCLQWFMHMAEATEGCTVHTHSTGKPQSARKR